MNNSLFFNLKKSIRRFSEYPLVELNDKKVPIDNSALIPNCVYQTWETNYFGKSHAKSIIKFRELNPDLSFFLYNKEKRDQYMQNNWGSHEISKIYFNSLMGPMKADIFRYCILYDYGGYYFDIAKGCKVPLSSLHENHHEAVLTYEDNFCFIPPDHKKLFNLKRPFNYFLQWGLAFSKNNKILNLLIDNICENYPYYKSKTFENPKLAILNFTGPGMYTKVIREYLKENDFGNLKELDIKFEGNGVFKLKGSTVRHYLVPSYTYIKNKKICD